MRKTNPCVLVVCWLLCGALSAACAGSATPVPNTPIPTLPLTPTVAPTLTASPTAPPTPSPAPPTPTPSPSPAPLPADYAKTPKQVTAQFLQSLIDDHSGGGSLVYLSRDLQTQILGGRSLLQVLGLLTVYRSFVLDEPAGDTGETATVQAALDLGADVQARVFMLKQEGGVWRIHAVAAGEQAGVDDPAQAAHEFLISLLKDPSGESSLNYLSRRLVAELQGGRTVYSILGIESAYDSFSYEVIAPDAGGVATIRVTLDYSQEVGAQVRTLTLIRENGWRIDAVAAP